MAHRRSAQRETMGGACGTLRIAILAPLGVLTACSDPATADVLDPGTAASLFAVLDGEITGYGTANVDTPATAYALPDEDLTDEVCQRTHFDYGNHYTGTDNINFYAEDVIDAAGRTRWNIAWDPLNGGRRSVYVYDEDAGPVAILSVWDGQTTVLHADVYTYDTAGRLATDGYDGDADGNFDSLSTWTYDADGREIRAQRDADLTDGVVEWHAATTWTPDGSVYVEEYDADSDTVVDYRETYSYDSAQQPLAYVFDSEVDGDPEEVDTWTRDEAGTLLTFIWTRPQQGVEGATSYAYDADGHLISEVTTATYPNDTPNGVLYAYNAEGLLSEAWEWSDSVENITYVIEYSYDSEGRETDALWFEDGRVEYRETFGYDEQGRLVSWEADWYEDGDPEDWNYYTFDEVPC